MECDHDILKKIRDYYISQIVKINSAMAILPSDLFFKILHFMYRYEHSTPCCNMD